MPHPAGGTSCALGTIQFPAQVSAPVFKFIRPQDGALIVVASGHDNAEDLTYISVSGDGGTTFSAPAPVGRGQFEVRPPPSRRRRRDRTLAQVPS